MLLKAIAHGIVHLFYPRLCEGCSKALLNEEHILCIGCLQELPTTNFHEDAENETTMRFAGRLPFERATSFAHFVNDGLLQHLLHDLKYKGKKENGIFLGRQLGHALKQTRWIQDIDMIVPVPLYPKKQAMRGYNQSELIAEGMRDVLNIPIVTNTLKRIRHTESQTQKSRTERIDNMQQAFAVTDKNKLSDKHILLVDDVLTTGATLEACAHALLTCKSVKISICTIGLA